MTPDLAEAASRLCLDCGMCCNGVLFDRVMLQPRDSPKALTARGIKVKKRSFFTQPCIALCGVQCIIYADRPTRCRLFECQQYQQVAKGNLPEAAARSRIEEVRGRVSQIERMLHELGNDNLRKSLAQRCANAMTAQSSLEPENEEKASAQRAELAVALEQLEAVLTTHFRVK